MKSFAALTVVILLAIGIGFGPEAASSQGYQPYLLWTSSTTGTQTASSTIAAASTALKVDQDLVTGFQGGAGIAVQGDFVYWAESTSAGFSFGWIGRARLNGSDVDVRFIKTDSFPVGVATNGDYVYWTENGLGGFIGRARLNGSHVQASFIAISRNEDTVIDGLTVTTKYLFWADNQQNTIGRADLDGSHVEPSFITDANRPTGVALANGDVFWTNAGDDSIGRATEAGDDVDGRCLVVPGVPLGDAPEGIATDGRHLFWTNYPADTIATANLDGTDAQTSLLSTAGVPEGVAVSARIAGTARLGTCRPQPSETLLGSSRYLSAFGAGWGQVAPPVIFNGGDPSGLISKIHWTSWGGRTAIGYGLNAIFKPLGGYYPQPVKIEVRASDLGRCSPGSPLAYRKLSVREPSKPNGPIGSWTTWTPNMCVSTSV